MIASIAVTAFLVVLGLPVLAVVGLRERERLLVVWVVGNVIVQLVTAVCVVADAPTGGLVVPVLSVLLSLGLWLVVRRSGVVVRQIGWRSPAVLGLVVLLLVGLVGWRHLVTWHSDSIQHLALASMLANDTFREFAHVQFVEMRGFGYAPSASLVIGLGGQYNVLAAPLTVSLMMWVLVGTVVDRWRARRLDGRWPAAGVLSVSALLVPALSNRVIWQSMYLNAHVMFAATLLAAVLVASVSVVGREGSGEDDRFAAFGVLAMVAAGLVLTRTEGLLVALPLLGAWSLSMGRRRRAVVLSLWLVVVVGIDRGAVVVSVSGSFVDLLRDEVFVSSLVALVMVGLISTFVRGRVRAMALWCVGSVLVAIGVVGVSAAVSSVVREAVGVAVGNLLLGEGSWGNTWWVLGGLWVLAWLVLGGGRVFTGATMVAGDVVSARRGFAKVASIWFFPMMMLSSIPRGSPGRPGHNDSLNRAAIHVMFVAVLFVIERAWAARGGSGSA